MTTMSNVISNEGESDRILQNDELGCVVGGAYSPKGCIPDSILLPGEMPLSPTLIRDLFAKHTIG
jgi:hypothetical protein